jgi:DNA polymerase-3 subunit epsilon
MRLWTKLKRWWYRRRAPEGPLRDVLTAEAPPGRADVRAVEFVALDLETTGLDPAADRIISVGHVRVAEGRVRMGTARHVLVQIDGSVAQSATIHGIRDADLDAGASEREALDEVLRVIAGRVLVMHNASFDLGFLGHACRRHYGTPLAHDAVCTLTLAYNQRRGLERGIRDGELRLQALRDAYGLPRYGAHNALTDALSTAELFLAMAAHRAGGSGRVRLKDVL